MSFSRASQLALGFSVHAAGGEQPVLGLQIVRRGNSSATHETAQSAELDTTLAAKVRRAWFQ